MDEKTLDVTNMEQLKEKVSDVQVYGDPGAWVCIAKASSKDEGWMKSTKVFEVRSQPDPLNHPNGLVMGCLVQVSTQQRNPDGSYAIAEALAYVPAHDGIKCFTREPYHPED